MHKGNVSIHLMFTIAYLVLATVSSMPFGTASKDCILGYNALCSFTPISTVIMVGLAVMHIVLDRSAKKKAAQES